MCGKGVEKRIDFKKRNMIQKNHSSLTIINVTRDSVSMGDDIYASHEYSFVLANDACLKQLLEHLSNNNYLASIAGKNHSWEAIIDNKSVAIFKSNSNMPESSNSLSTDISEFVQNGEVFLHFKYNSSIS